MTPPPSDKTVTAPEGHAPAPRAAEAPSPALVVVHHPNPALVGDQLVLTPRGSVTVGRGGDVFPSGVLDDELLSRRHLEVTLGDRGIRGRDLGSRNGTRVNGTVWTNGDLRAGDVIGIGSLLLFVSERPWVRALPSAAADAPVYASSAMAQAVERARMVARLDTTVLIQGPTGSGKDVLAREIHRASERRGAYVAVNCAALGDGVLQSELFGHRRGAFSGAEQDRVGLVESARDGTLFLDEIGDSSPLLQATLLRLLEQGEYRRVGDDTVRTSSARVVAATHRLLDEVVQAGRFRADLAARLTRFVIELPPLALRPEDVIPLAMAHARAVAGTAAKLTAELTVALLRHDWPANVRELRSVIEQAWVEGGSIDTIGVTRGVAARLVARPTLPVAAPAAPEKSPKATRPTAAELERLLAEEGGNLRSLARRLGVNRATLYRWASDLGVDLARARGH